MDPQIKSILIESISVEDDSTSLVAITYLGSTPYIWTKITVGSNGSCTGVGPAGDLKWSTTLPPTTAWDHETQEGDPSMMDLIGAYRDAKFESPGSSPATILGDNDDLVGGMSLLLLDILD